jgi:hypothetical protein
LPTVYVRFFGRKWDAPLLDDGEGVVVVRVRTPVGVPCLYCQDKIVLGDRGLIRTYVPEADHAVEVPVHNECELLQIMGHDMGVCGCTGFPETNAEARRELLRRIDAERAGDGRGPLYG